MLKRFLPPRLADLVEESSRQQTNRELFYVIVTCVIIMTLLVLWAVFIRKPKRKSLGRALSDAPAKLYRDSRDAGRRRKRRRRWKHRNPTLSETGGLPPARTNSDTSPL